MYKALIIGHNRPYNPEFPEALLPVEVTIWDSSKIPANPPEDTENVEVVFVDSSIPSRLLPRLEAMFPGKVMRLSSTMLFHARFRQYFPELADDVVRYLSEKPRMPYEMPPEKNPHGSIRYQSKYSRFL